MKINIGVLFGGRSVEHEISVISAIQVMKALDRDKYEVTPIYISREGVWYTGVNLDQVDSFKNYGKLIRKSRRIIPSLNAGDGRLMSYPGGLFNSSKVISKIDLAFPVFHGTYGEDGSVQGVLEMMGIPYVGSGVLSSAVCMDKSLTKEVCKSIDIAVIEYVKLDADSWFMDKESVLEGLSTKFKYPIIVKPNDLGSSIGVTRVLNVSELRDAIDLAAIFSSTIIVERCVSPLREVNCSVARTPEEILVSECEEPVAATENMLTFDEKYLSSGASSEGIASAKRELPANITEDMKHEIQGYALRIYGHLNCSGIVRVDFIIDKQDGKIYLNEINTTPGSLAFYLWEASGKKFTAILSDVIKSAELQFRRKDRLKKNFKSDVLFNVDGAKLSGKLG